MQWEDEIPTIDHAMIRKTCGFAYGISEKVANRAEQARTLRKNRPFMAVLRAISARNRGVHAQRATFLE
jgi:hypothetical protein